MKFLRIFLIIAATTGNSWAQKVSNVQAYRELDHVVVNYNLEHTNKVNVSLYISENKGQDWNGPLVNVSGDVGTEVGSGNNKIFWDITKEQKMLYGDNIVFKVNATSIFGFESGSFKDERDGAIYETIIISSSQACWLAQNLNFVASEGSWCYNNLALNCNKYGRLYTWEAAMHACPPGWRLPSKDDWLALADAYGGDTIAGMHIKAQTYWGNQFKSPNENLFNALPSGFRSSEGIFSTIDNWGFWWTSTPKSQNESQYVSLSSKSSHLIIPFFSNLSAFSVRCIKE